MLGLSIDKLLVVAIAAALIIGPQRLPGYAQRLGEIVRGLRSFLDAARERAEAETGLSREDWQSLDPWQYDPRRIVREALAEPAAAAASTATAPAPAMSEPDARAVPDAMPGAAATPDPGPAEPVSAPSPAARYIITGSSAHPRRVLVSASAPPPGADGERESAVELT